VGGVDSEEYRDVGAPDLKAPSLGTGESR